MSVITMLVSPARRLRALAALAVTALLSCDHGVEVGLQQQPAAGGAGATSGGTGGVMSSGGQAGVVASGGNAGAMPCEPVACERKVEACGDCVDNDGDGRADALDPECLGPCDTSEATFFPLEARNPNSRCEQDCYFDDDIGAGNDGCRWTQECDPRAVAPDYPPAGPMCPYDPDARVPGSSATCAELQVTQAPRCMERCMPLVPNGCDCFGCCELPAGEGRFVWIGTTVADAPSCDPASADDPERCAPCTPVEACLNRCEDCEVCVGAGAPLNCTDGEPRCPTGRTACGQPGDASCDAGEYCITGCCAPVPVPE